jgi:hypothetical protein
MCFHLYFVWMLTTRTLVFHNKKYDKWFLRGDLKIIKCHFLYARRGCILEMVNNKTYRNTNKSEET